MASVKDASKGKKVVIPNKDLLCRINFLHQASLLMATTAPGLSQTYVLDMKTVARKSQLSVDRSIKRQVCKRCHSILVSGVSSSRIIINRSRRQKSTCDVLSISCLRCGTNKHFPQGMSEFVDS